MKKIFYVFLFSLGLLFIGILNTFLKINSDLNHILGINIILVLQLLIIIFCAIITNRHFKNIDFKNSKNYRKDIKTAFANSFFATSIFSIFSACIIYGFLKNILEVFNLQNGVINYCIFASKIWFISSPFIGLEVAVFKYFFTIDYFKKPIIILIFKLILFLLISFLFYGTRKINCFVYAKPICDIFFLLYYSRICFDITLSNT